MKRWKAILGVIGVFLFGIIAGAILTAGAYEQVIRIVRGDKNSGDIVVQRLSRELRLDETQRAQLRMVVAEAQAQLRPIRQEMQPKIEAILKESEARVRATLRPDQQKK